MPKNVATGKGRWTALTKKDMKHLHEHNVFTRIQFYDHLSTLKKNRNCERCWIICDKLEAYHEKKEVIGFTGYFKKTQFDPIRDGTPAPPLSVSPHQQVREINDWLKYQDIQNRFSLSGGVRERAAWNPPPLCPHCSKPLLLLLFTFPNKDRYAFDICKKCNYARLYNIYRPKTEEDMPTTVSTSPAAFQRPLF